MFQVGDRVGHKELQDAEGEVLEVRETICLVRWKINGTTQRMTNLLSELRLLETKKKSPKCHCRSIDLIGKGHDFDCPHYRPPKLTYRSRW